MGLLFPYIWRGVRALFYFISLCQKDADLLARVQSRSEGVIQSWEGHMCEKRLAGEEETRPRDDSGQIKAAGLSEMRQDEESFAGVHEARAALEEREKLSQHGRQCLRTIGQGRKAGS